MGPKTSTFSADGVIWKKPKALPPFVSATCAGWSGKASQRGFALGWDLSCFVFQKFLANQDFQMWGYLENPVRSWEEQEEDVHAFVARVPDARRAGYCFGYPLARSPRSLGGLPWRGANASAQDRAENYAFFFSRLRLGFSCACSQKSIRPVQWRRRFADGGFIGKNRRVCLFLLVPQAQDDEVAKS